MSYSFGVVGANKEDALRQVKAKLEEMVIGQPSHEKDMPAALAAAESFIGLMIEEESDISVSMNGSLWTDNTGVRQASVSVSVCLSSRAVKEAPVEN